MHPILDGVRNVFFDLDDTLLANDMQRFLPAYFAGIGRFVQRELGIQAEVFCHLLHQAVRELAARGSGELTNAEFFWSRWQALGGAARSAVEPALVDFYAGDYLSLVNVTAPVKDAKELVEACAAAGKRLILATNPVFPRAAIMARLSWTGIDSSLFSHITTLENSHSTKPHRQYYESILQRLGLDAADSLMVGNDLEQDIRPASAVGMRTFWAKGEQLIQSGGASESDGSSLVRPTSQGSLGLLLSGGG